jgi:hypothetical protein
MASIVKCAALDFSIHSMALDHLVPLCEAMQMPLILTESKKHNLLKKYYPFTGGIYHDHCSINYDEISKKHDLLFQATFWQNDPIQHFAKMNNKKVCFAFCPSGNTDKGYKTSLLDPIVHQDLVLLYGDHMKERLRRQNLWEGIKNHVFIGNYRYEYFRKYRAYFDEAVNKEIFCRLDKKKKTILYAPTWQDLENSSSFFSFTSKLLGELTPYFNIIIKPHHLIEHYFPAKYYSLISKIKELKNVVVLEDYPLVYPLLEKTDIYIGDFSSVGYDFLVYQRPMFFVDAIGLDAKDPSLFLHQCGFSLSQNFSSSFIKKMSDNWPEEKKK